MAARNLLQLYHADPEGDVLAGQAITLTTPDGDPIALPLYDQATGGSPVVDPKTGSRGTATLYAEYADLEAAGISRVKVSYADDPGTTFDDAFWPDPANVWIDGTIRDRTLGGSLDVAQGLSVTHDHASEPTLTLQQSDDTGRVLLVKAYDGSTLLEHTRTEDPLFHVAIMDVFSLKGNARLNYDANGGFLFANRIVQFVTDDATTDRVMAWFQYTNHSPIGIGTPDVEPFGIGAFQAAGTDSYIRAVELDMISHTTTSNWPKIGVEVSAQFADAGNTKDFAVGISIRNLPQAWGIASGVRGDSAIGIGSDQAGWENGILYRDIDNPPIGDGPLLWKVTKTGAVVHAGTQSPRDDGVAHLGTPSRRYGILYGYNTYLEAGLPTAPAYTWRASSGTGLYLDGTPGIGMAVAGTSRALLTASGLTVNGAAVRVGGQSSFASNLAGSTTANYATITNGSLNLPQTTGGTLIVRANICAANTTVAAATYLAFSLDGADEVGEVVSTATLSSGQFLLAAMWRFTGVPAGSHTVTARWKHSAGTTTIYSGQMLLEEEPH